MALPEDAIAIDNKMPEDVISVGTSMPSDAVPINTSMPSDATPIAKGNPTAGGMAKQFGIGFGNELLAGFPLFSLSKVKGEESVKKLESQVTAERIARGTGTTIGFAVGLPKLAFEVGMKLPSLALKGILGAEKAAQVNRFGLAAARGAGGFATTDLLHAPEESYKEKVVTVPTSALLGAATFGVGEKFAPEITKFLQKKGLINKGYISGTPELDKLNKVLSAGEQAQEQVQLKTKQISPLIYETQLVDRLAPIRHIQESAQQVSGKQLKFEEKPYEAARNFAGIGGKVIGRFNEIATVLNKDRANVKPVSQIFTAQRLLERANRGFDNPHGVTAQEATKQLMDLEKLLGTPKFQELNSIAQGVREITKKSLSDLLDAGVLDKAGFQKITSENQFYAPFEVFSKLADNPEFFPIGVKSLSVKQPGFLKGLEGTDKDINDPLSAVMRYVANSTKLAEKNKVLRKVIDLRNIHDELKSQIIPMGVKDSVPAGYKKISVFEDGARNEYAMPSILADSISGLNSEAVDLMTRFASLGTKALRSGATQLNLAFIIPNIIRDVQTAQLVSKTGFGVTDWIRGFASTLKQDALYEKFLKSGASFGSPQVNLGRRIPANIQELVPTPLEKANRILNPVKWLNKIAQLSEESTRVGVFGRGLRQGLPLEESAFNARNATIDFAKHGTAMQVANMWVPFLNARVQGTLNLVDAFKKDPKRAALIGSGIVGLPLTSTYMWNTTQFPDVWDSIPRYDKNNNFIMIANRNKDANGRFTGVVKIPKGDVGKILGNPLESFYEYLRGNNPDFTKVALSVLNEISPVGITPTSVISSITPPPLKALYEGVTNKNTYTGRDIVPQSMRQASPKEQYTERTAPEAVMLGKLLNISPVIIENSVGSMFGGLGRAVINPINSGRMLSGRFVGSADAAEETRKFDILNNIIQETEDGDAQRLRLVRQALIDFKQLPEDSNVRAEFVKNTFNGDKKAIESFIDLALADKQGNSPLNRVLDKRPTKDKLRYIKEISSQMATNEEKLLFMKEMLDKKIVTKEGIKRYLKEQE